MTEEQIRVLTEIYGEAILRDIENMNKEESVNK